MKKVPKYKRAPKKWHLRTEEQKKKAVEVVVDQIVELNRRKRDARKVVVDGAM